MSYILCFLNLQSQSYKLAEDIRKPAVGATSLSADEPVSTFFVEDERGTVVLQHLLLWFMVALGGTAMHRGSFSFVVNTGTRKLGKNGLSHSVEYYNSRILSALKFQKLIFFNSFCWEKYKINDLCQMMSFIWSNEFRF